ncbi:MAG: hypothetical protein MUP22_05795, partial [Desulfobacterales bacterium]|nr:hypothetical protein [Desulfobacterales bacterium]
RITHYENEKDVDGAFAERTAWWAYTSRDGVLWISTLFGNLYRIDLLRKEIPHYTLMEGPAKGFYQEPNRILWIGTANGIVRKDSNNAIVPWKNLEITSPEIPGKWIQVLKGDDQGNIWIGGQEGLTQWNMHKGQFITYLINPKNENSLNNVVTAVVQEGVGNLWLGTAMGLSFLDHKTGSSTQYLLNPIDTAMFGQNFITAVLLDKNGRLWVGSLGGGGLNLFNREKGTFKNYLNVFRVNCIFEDGDSIVWVGTNDGLYKYDNGSDRFIRYKDLNTLSEISSVSAIVEDNQHNLWFGTSNGIVKIDSRRNETSVYGKNYGVGEIGNWINSSYKGLHGEIYFGDATGYYQFNPMELTKNVRPPEIIITAFSLADQIIKPDKNGPLRESLSQVKEIRLRYDQNVFSFDFAAIDYTNPEANQHLFMLENYDITWRQANSEHRAYYFNIPSGKYIFKIKVANSYGVWTEKKIEITILPPWWRTWWAYTLMVTLFIAVIWAIIYNRSRQLLLENKILEEKVNHRTTELQHSLENLKSAQAQLVQSEKMASLGELTAGIAHEIQNPLNFV